MENKFNFGSFLIGMFVVLILLIPTAVKLSNIQKEKTLKEYAEYKPDSTFMPFSLEYSQYIAQFYQASKTGDGHFKRVDVLLLNKNTNDTYNFHVVLDGHDYKYLHEHAAEFVERKTKKLPDKPLIKGEPVKTINDTINDVFITEYSHYRCIMILNPSQKDPNEVLIYIQDRERGTTVPLHTTLNERYNWDSLKVHSADFTKRTVELMFE